MGGQKFQYDESGSTFLYFVLSFLGLILIPSTYYFWPNPKIPDAKKHSGVKCNCEQCQLKDSVLKKKEPKRKLKRFAIRVALTLGWILFLFVLYKVTQAEYEYANFDPYEILGVEMSSSQGDIKKAYRKLSLIYHPDKETGNEKLFMKLTKAYQALTDDTARRNWEKYGNPDGPGAMSFGIALPSWIVDKENSVWVLGLYTLVFMVALPTTVGIWWYRSIQYSSDKVLLDTTQLYYYFFHKTPHMILKRSLMVLAASLEFERGHNSEVQERQSDNTEVPQLIKQLQNLNEKNKERPLCFPYSVKARALLHAHLSRLPLNPMTLELDRQLVVRKCPYLIQEMVTCVSQLIMLAHAGRIARLPSLETIESVMKMCPMIVQALWEIRSPLLQLPHITEEMQKYFLSKKRQIRSIQEFCQLKEEDRRAVLKSLSDNQYSDVTKVCASMPLINFNVHVEVLDDEESGVVTAGAIVTVTCSLKRQSLSCLLKGEVKEISHLSIETHGEEEGGEEEGDGKEDGDGKAQPQKNKPVWQRNKKGGGKKSNSNSNKNKGNANTKKVVQVVKSNAKESTKSSGKENINDKEGEESVGSKNKEIKDNSQEENDSDDEGVSENSDSDHDSSDSGEVKEKGGDLADDDAEWEKCQTKLAKNKERALEGKSKISHPVHCPYFPDVKQEHWWTYVSDHKTKQLLTAPFLVTDLIETQECELQFTAPRKPGLYSFTVWLRSDSYIGFDQSKEIKLDVQNAKEIEEHPQWEMSDEEEEKTEESAESEYTTDDDIEEDEE